MGLSWVAVLKRVYADKTMKKPAAAPIIAPIKKKPSSLKRPAATASSDACSVTASPENEAGHAVSVATQSTVRPAMRTPAVTQTVAECPEPGQNVAVLGPLPKACHWCFATADSPCPVNPGHTIAWDSYSSAGDAEDNICAICAAVRAKLGLPYRFVLADTPAMTEPMWQVFESSREKYLRYLQSLPLKACNLRLARRRPSF